MAIKLRPHHLLCTQTYRGKGYSEDFVENMDKITSILRNNPETLVDIIASTDDICEKCPRLVEKGMCATDDKVNRIDSKVMKYFGVHETTYVYGDIVDEINRKANALIIKDICGECEWYSFCCGLFDDSFKSSQPY